MESKNNNLAGHTLKHQGVAWVDLERPGPTELAELEVKYRLHPVHLHESIQKVQHSKVEVEDDYLFFVLHFPIFHKRSNKILFGQIGFFLGKDFIVTIRSADCASLAGLKKDEPMFKHGPAYILYAIINGMIDELSKLTDIVVGELDELEDVVFANGTSDARRIGQVRQKIVRLLRIIGPKRVILEDLSERISTFASHDIVKLYSSNTKLATKLWEIIEEAKETVEIYKDADFTTSTERTNAILAILTLIFTLSIPVTVLGALYGMNVPLPGGIETGAWTFLGRYTTLGIVLALSALAAIWMYAYFKKKRWF